VSATAAPTAPASGPAAAGGGPKRNAVVGAVVASLAVAGAAGFFLTRGGAGEAGPSPVSTVTTVDAATTTQQPATTIPAAASLDVDLSAAYAAILGAQPSAATLSCLTSSVDAGSADLANFLAGTPLSLPSAQATFAPFIGCAPDADFLTDMVTVSQQVLGATGDVACIQQTLVALDITTRTQAIALAHADPQTFVDQLFTTVAGCA